jgi:uncharacterized membrane protein
MIDAIVGMLSQGIHLKEVAQAVIHAINNLKIKLRHTVGKDAEELIEASNNLSEDFYRTIAQSVLKKEGQQPRQEKPGCTTIITQNNERGVS